jgi:glutamine---fructose-6-phosphate transaminase (isomerizing)
MCGIFGIVVAENSDCSNEQIDILTRKLFLLSESRGKEASGIAIKKGSSIYVFKQAIPASKLIKSSKFKDMMQIISEESSIKDRRGKRSLAIIGHARLVTTGAQQSNTNNQPVIKDGAVGIHNGIIVNDNELWKRFSEINRQYDVDTEVILGLIQMYNKNASLASAIRDTYANLEGTASIGVLFKNYNQLAIATNNGSLYVCINGARDLLVFASEKYIIIQLILEKKLKNLWKDPQILQVKPNSGYIINLLDLDKIPFVMGTKNILSSSFKSASKYDGEIVDLSDEDDKYLHENATYRRYLDQEIKTDEGIQEKVANQPHPGKNIKRCTKCVLPETMPFIEFDEKGVCNYCRNYSNTSVKVKGRDALEEILSKYRNPSGESDCLVGFSGGRDSSFGLHYIKKVLNMNPIAWTYDWGMVTDLGRRNQARICGKLGVEHIVVSADIEEKRKNILRNIKAWLRKPDLGMVPLLMAGDKQYYYYAHKLREQTGIKPMIFCTGNSLEETLFKYGFCGISDGNSSATLTKISPKNKIKMLLYYGKQYLLNPGYINFSFLDTLFAYYSTYVLPDDYLYLYHYIQWDENEIATTLRREYDWEVETDTTATWRIGDGTASFYNYIYYTVAGFTEFDTFRSNQIRQGLITRDEALKLLEEDHKPRLKSMQWYARTIGFDLNEALDVIHSMKKLWSS